MKLAHISGIFGDCQALDITKQFLSRQGLEVVTCSGDILGPIYTLQETTELSTLEKNLFQIKRLNEFTGTLSDFADTIMQNKAPKELKQMAEKYSQLITKAETEAKKQYPKLREILYGLNTDFLLIPGNSDTRNLFDYFGWYSPQFLNWRKPRKKEISTLHYTNPVEVNGASITGFGAFVGATDIAIPIDKRIFISKSDFKNETKKFEHADIAVSYCAPRIFYDDEDVPSHSPFIDFMVEATPSLILCGYPRAPGLVDIASNCNAGEKNRHNFLTRVLTVGNLGRYRRYKDQSMKQTGPYGSFAVVDLDRNNFLQKVVFYQIHDVNKGLSSIEERHKFSFGTSSPSSLN